MGAGRSSRLVFHLVTVLAVVLCVFGAWWQWQRAHRSVAEAVPDVPAVSWAQFDPSNAYSGQRVVVSGRYLPQQVLVAPRQRAGESGSWVYSALVPDSAPAMAGESDEGAGTGQRIAAIGVIRGWVAQGTTADALVPPAGQVSVAGILVADERRPGYLPTEGSDGLTTMGRVDSGALSEATGRPVRAGWLALTGMNPALAGQPTPLEVRELPGADVGLNWRNAAYAVQWLAFAAFAMFFWNRFRRDYFSSELPEKMQEEADA